MKKDTRKYGISSKRGRQPTNLDPAAASTPPRPRPRRGLDLAVASTLLSINHPKVTTIAQQVAEGNFHLRTGG